MSCPKCGNDWVYDKDITMMITKTDKFGKRPEGKRFHCNKCKMEWD